MAEANILIRTGGDRVRGWVSLVRVAAVEARLRAAWPLARVTVIAEGEPEVIDWMWRQVRDLVVLRPEPSAHEEAAARSLRGHADLVLLDLPWGLRPDCAEAWREDSAQVVVREPLTEWTEGGPVAARRWVKGEDPVQEILGFDHAMLDPRILRERRRRRAHRPAGVVVRIDGQDAAREVALVSGLSRLPRELGDVVIVSTSTFGRRHAEALERAGNGRVRVDFRRGRFLELASSARLAVSMGPSPRPALAALGVPQVVVLGTDDADAAIRFCEAGSAVPADFPAEDSGALAGTVANLLGDEERLRAMGNAGIDQCDGLGYGRVLLRSIPDAPFSLASLHGIEAPQIEGQGARSLQEVHDQLIVTEPDQLRSA